MLNNSTILVTGGTGSFGSAFVENTLAKYKPKKIIVFSRNEVKQWEMAQKFHNDSRIRFFLGDVRDRERLYRALDGVDLVVHAAATKMAQSAEYNPFECIKTNINGAMNLIDACIDKGVKRVVALSDETASAPVGLNGATKLTAEKLFISANSYTGGRDTRFAVARFGDMLGAGGSVPLFALVREASVLAISDPSATRFMVTAEQGVELVWHVLSDMEGGEIYVKKSPSVTLQELASTIDPKAEIRILGLRPGEKLHEQMIGSEDAKHTYEYDGYFKVLSANSEEKFVSQRIKRGIKVAPDFSYSSINNPEKSTREDIEVWLRSNRSVLAHIQDLIPYGRQDITRADIDAVLSVFHSDFLTQGPAVPRFERRVADHVGAKFGVAVNSATSALHLACLALDLGPGDILWTTPITFVASANCGIYCGASIDFVDIDPVTYNLCPQQLEKKLLVAERENRLPKVVVPVHLCGQPCNMEAIARLAERFKFSIIEDASHAIGGKYKGEYIGNCRYSDITVFSFHPVKIVTTGEGGIALTNTPELAERMALLRSHGITRDANRMNSVPDGPWYYQQIELGFNYRMTEVQAALGYSQMSRLDDYVARRHQIARRYDEALAGLPLVTPKQDADAYSAFHLYVVRCAGAARRDVFERLRAAGIGVNVHYIPVHTQPYYRQRGFLPGDFPLAEAYYAEAISLPLFPTLTEADQDAVIAALRDALAAQTPA